jgi:hypothetical protein
MPYNAGDVAGFAPAIADGLIAIGTAEAVTQDRPIETPKTQNPDLKESKPEKTKESAPQKTKELKPEKTK